MDFGGPIGGGVGGGGGGGGAGGMAAFGDHQGIDLMSWYTSMPGTSDKKKSIYLFAVFVVARLVCDLHTLRRNSQAFTLFNFCCPFV